MIDYSGNSVVAAKRAGRHGRTLVRAAISAMLLAGVSMPFAARTQAPQTQPQLKRTYVRLADYGFKPEHDRDANAVLVEPAQPSPNERIVAINTHPKNRNNFEYFIGDVLGARGYRVIEVNDYGSETPEALLQPIAAAVRYARSLPGVEKVVLVGHSGGGPVLSYYQEIAEKGPSACQQADRLYPCSGKGLTGLPKADALLLLEANIGAPHRTLSIDPAVDNRNPRARNPALDMYASQNGFDPQTNSAHYSADFVRRYQAAMHERSERVIADARAQLKAIDDHTSPFTDDAPFMVAGMSENASGARLNLADPNILSQTHAPHMLLKADGTTPVEIVPVVRKPAATPERQRDTLGETTQNMTVRQYLAFSAITTTSDFTLGKDAIKGVDWRSSANSAPGNVENITVPTLVMAGSCMIHLVPLETTYDHSAAKDKQFIVVEGADHYFEPCRPEFGNTQKRAFDYVQDWLTKHL
jgi:pimeloyl-ACP methyl ester carboxylesterase